MAVRVVRLCRYPVKGLSAEDLARVTLERGECLPHDRRFALARAATDFDPRRPRWLPKTSFLMLMRDEKLAQLRTRFEEASGELSIEHRGRLVLSAPIATAAGRETVTRFFSDFVGSMPRLVEAPGHAFSDARQKCVSIVNLESVRALEAVARAPVDPIRFRANVYVDGLPAWKEFDWVGSGIALGEARLRIVSRIVRCAATAVNPQTAERDLMIPSLLQRSFGHDEMGVYGEVLAGGEVAVGDAVLATGGPA
jgi:uncharacterized protein